jgi:photosystem II stability/assembly factor-like uncharacterized protein
MTPSTPRPAASRLALWRRGVPALASALTLLVALPIDSQRPAARKPTTKPAAESPSSAKPRFKGIWEPVSYPEDIYMTDVHFVSPDVGWVASGRHGQGGMLLHTKDGGATWSVQLGDHESKEGRFFGLHFLDERNGWALQDAGAYEYKLLRTTGESWEDAGLMKTQWGLRDYTFVSPNNGVYLEGNDNVSRIMRTSDGGRTWQEVFQCETKLEVDGLTRDIKCALKSHHFPTASVGYAIGGAHGAKRTLFVAKTENGGESWTLHSVPGVGGDTEVYHEHEVHFIDENTGFVTTSGNRLYRTSDGGRTWTGVVAKPGPVIRFADSAVGWSFSSNKTLNYTTDGGRRWNSRELPFPATVTAFSLPRPNRGYAVGEHGMVYRYRVIPATEPTPPKAFEGPVMPGGSAKP